MPHVSVIFNPAVVSGDLLFSASAEITQIVARHLEKDPVQVTVEIRPVTKWTINRKDVDVEVSFNLDPEGKRIKIAKALATELGEWYLDYLRKKGVDCELSVWIQIFGEGAYLTF
jgi:hypothetical protein